jgi:ribonuclease-3
MREIPGIPYQFEDPALLQLALSHRSVGKINNERLEFLGDSMLSSVVSARLFEVKPGNDEGDLSRFRARVVRGNTLAKLAADLKLGDYLKLGEGEMKSGGFNRDSILADALEAIFGAIYIDGGYEACAAVILQICEPVIASLPSAAELKDPKTRLQEWLQGRGHALPIYSLVSEKGPPHKKQFLVQCTETGAGIKVEGTGSSRQKAEQSSAAAALVFIAESFRK